MTVFLIQNVQIDILLSLLKTEYSDKLEKVWESGGMINGVFIRSELVLRTMSEQSITVVLQHYTDKRECEVTVVSSGGGDGLLRIDLGSQAAAESTFKERLKELSRIHEWKLYEKRFDRAGTLRCPFCSACYVYAQSQVQPDNSVRCQNCNKSFTLDRSKIEGPYLREIH
jgi:predicted Zn finger-like uncharacterized protein